ncbi:hypothetical protein JKP88DRAFT_230322 [Tribonema minus]|uniref:Uncharacterized protein n=1 Tax=Tribonema minus TaxID=303371 RepID=A0A835ZFV8_9STRA|nr:hypothetical protein JKP88DRAFT_230322 [Tribonema minus]
MSAQQCLAVAYAYYGWQLQAKQRAVVAVLSMQHIRQLQVLCVSVLNNRAAINGAGAYGGSRRLPTPLQYDTSTFYHAHWYCTERRRCCAACPHSPTTRDEGRARHTSLRSRAVAPTEDKSQMPCADVCACVACERARCRLAHGTVTHFKRAAAFPSCASRSTYTHKAAGGFCFRRCRFHRCCFRHCRCSLRRRCRCCFHRRSRRSRRCSSRPAPERMCQRTGSGSTSAAAAVRQQQQ